MSEYFFPFNAYNAQMYNATLTLIGFKCVQRSTELGFGSLFQSSAVGALLKEQYSSGRLVAAICAG